VKEVGTPEPEGRPVGSCSNERVSGDSSKLLIFCPLHSWPSLWPWASWRSLKPPHPVRLSQSRIWTQSSPEQHIASQSHPNHPRKAHWAAQSNPKQPRVIENSPEELKDARGRTTSTPTIYRFPFKFSLFWATWTYSRLFEAVSGYLGNIFWTCSGTLLMLFWYAFQAGPGFSRNTFVRIF
jgi:hypothetical protein